MQPYYTDFNYHETHAMFCSECQSQAHHKRTLFFPLIGKEQLLKMRENLSSQWSLFSNILNAYSVNLTQNYYKPPYIIRNTCTCGHYTYDICFPIPEKERNVENHNYSFTRIYPPAIPNNIPSPNEDMSEECATIYNEAAQVFSISPRASAALMRLCLQQFFNEQKIAGNSINDQIKELIRRGMPEHIIQYVDSCRIIGNNGVHPGEIDLNDNTDMASSLFPIMNLIIEYLVSEKKKASQIYNSLPPGAVQAAERRNAAVYEAEKRERKLSNPKDDQGREINVDSSSQPSDQ